MKKNLFLILMILFMSSIAFAQFGKGTCFTAGYSNLGIDIGSEKTQYSGGEEYKYKYSEFNFNPYAGYFVMDQLAAGLFLDFDYYKNTNKEDDYSDYGSSFGIGPFIRYYISDFNGLWPYAEGKIGLGSSKYTEDDNGDKYEDNASMFTYRLGVGGTYFLGDHVGFDLFMGYDYDSYKWEFDNSGSKATEADFSDKYSSFEMNLGIVVTFGK